jgi:hypothetical protein
VELEDGSFWEVNLLVFWAVGWERNEKERKKVGLLKKDPDAMKVHIQKLEINECVVFS